MNIAQGTFENSVVGSTINQSGKRKASDDLEASECSGDDESLDEDVSRVDQDEQGEGTPAAAAAQPLQANDDPPYKEFVAAYKAMTEESKFVFSETGRVLEDVIFENASVLTEKNIAHLWVVDMDHPVVTSWFRPEELEELRNQMLPMPELDEPFLESMARFSHVGLSNLIYNIFDLPSARILSYVSSCRRTQQKSSDASLKKSHTAPKASLTTAQSTLTPHGSISSSYPCNLPTILPYIPMAIYT